MEPPPAKKAKNDELQIVRGVREKKVLFSDDELKEDGTTYWLKAKLPANVSELTLNCVAHADKASQSVTFRELPQNQEWVGLRVTKLRPANETGYAFTATVGSEVLGTCRVNTGRAPAPAAAAAAAAAPERKKPSKKRKPAAAPPAQPPPPPPPPSQQQPPLTPNELADDIENWIKKSDGITAKEKGVRFERFMAFFMRHVGVGTMHKLQDSALHFDSVEVTQASWDDGKDVICMSQKGNVLLQCKNYATAVSTDLLHTMISKLLYSHERRTETKYVTAIAAVYPDFANTGKITGIKNFASDILRGKSMNLKTFAWNGKDGIKDELLAFMNEPLARARIKKRIELVKDHLDRDFPDTQFE